MEDDKFVSKLSSIKKRELTEEEFLREANSNSVMAAFIDTLVGLLLFFNALAITKTTLFGNFTFTGYLINKRSFYIFEYYSKLIPCLGVEPEVLDKLVFEITIIPLGILVMIILSFWYHCSLYRKTKFLSPGEMLIGTRVNCHKYKTYENPHLTNRGIVYTTFLVNLVFILNMFAPVIEGCNVYSLVHLLIKLSIPSLLILGMYFFGKGNLLLTIISSASANLIGYLQSKNLIYIIVNIKNGFVTYPEQHMSKIFYYMLYIQAIGFTFILIKKVVVRIRLKSTTNTFTKF